MTRQEYNREASSHATCNWVEVRNQAAIAAMQAILNSGSFRGAKVEAAINVSESPYKTIAISATLFADALVKQLKGE